MAVSAGASKEPRRRAIDDLSPERIREVVTASRAEQGLPPTIEDPHVLADVGVILDRVAQRNAEEASDEHTFDDGGTVPIMAEPEFCEHCRRPVQPGTIHQQVRQVSCVVVTPAQVERSEAMENARIVLGKPEAEHDR